MTRTSNATAPLLELDDLVVRFKLRSGRIRRAKWLDAVRGVGLSLFPGEAVGLVGESGSGKSTTGRAALRLLDSSAGAVRFRGQDLTDLTQRELRPIRRHMQMVFQDPYSSLDPSADIAEIIGEPLGVHFGMKGAARDERVRELLAHVGLSPRHINRYPYEFSGGQRQRIAIARAISVSPDLLVLDEAVSALDVSTQNQILELLASLRAEFGLTFLFISHNLAVVQAVTDWTAVMYLGQLVEQGPTRLVYSSPAHPYTQSLLSAVPVPDPVAQRSRERIVLHGDSPDPSKPPPGCAFNTRCPYVMERCLQEPPSRTPLDHGGWVSCHLHVAASTAGGGAAERRPTTV